MCTLVLLRRKHHDWPLLLAANRDEMSDRPWLPPDYHWPDRPGVLAGRDSQAGGSWLGLNSDGVIAGVLNRPGSLGPASGYRSRGELVLEALEHAEALEARAALLDLEPASYRPFNLLVADRHSAHCLVHDGRQISAIDVSEGLHMLTAHGMDATASARARRYLPRFRVAPVPDPAQQQWSAWERLLASREHAPGEPEGAMNLRLSGGFGTVCATLIALPAHPGEMARFRFAAGPPDQAEFRERTG
ncbi:MAG: NRDE family protein [Gammaproteobacteria bacterium]|nr:NRDE family protein [Gammaproteobacteria bacterium]